MKERLFVTPEYTTAKEIKQIRKELHLTQKEFAEFINCSKPTVERWERSDSWINCSISKNVAKISGRNQKQGRNEYIFVSVKNKNDRNRN